MKIWFHEYALHPRAPLSARHAGGTHRGALLRVDGGYADVHPWPELGDAPLDEQLSALARGEFTPLTERSLWFARLDGEARRAGVSLFDGLTIPRSHWPGADPPPGFDTVKLKYRGERLELPDGVRLRIDCNGVLDREQAIRFAGTLPKDRIDFIEDPCPYEPAAWNAIRERTGLRLALDREVARDGVDVVVIKPAIQHVPDIDREIVITSYMDHPVGQFCAAYIAALRALPESRCGLMTHVLFEPDAFLERVQRKGDRLLAPAGTGLGFDDLLEMLPWRELR